MKLLLDVGNSRLKWAWLSTDGLVGSGHATHRRDGLSGVLADLLRNCALPDEVRVANVAGPSAAALVAEAVFARFGRSAVFARSRDAAYGLRNGYRDPAQLGVDRWLAMCAAWQKFSGPLCVVDAGTAVTIDVITADGAHSGGLILPGMSLMAAALRQDTGDLDRFAGRESVDMLTARTQDRYSLGSDTASAIRLGAMRAIAALVADCLEALNAETRLMMTGGDGAQLARLIDIPAVFDPDLVLEGLALEPACYSAS